MGLHTESLDIGIAKIVDSVQEGFHNAPAIYGSTVRKPGKIRDWKSGFTEGGRVRTLRVVIVPLIVR